METRRATSSSSNRMGLAHTEKALFSKPRSEITRPKSVLGLMRDGGREEELAHSTVSKVCVELQIAQMSFNSFNRNYCFQKGLQWVEQLEQKIKMRPSSVKLMDSVAERRETRRIFEMDLNGISLPSHIRSQVTESLAKKPEPPVEHLLRASSIHLSDIPDGEFSTVHPIR